MADALLVVLLGIVLGPFVGLTSNAPYYDPGFKLALGVALAVAIALFVAGIRRPFRWWRLPLLALGVLLWTTAGLLALGPV